MIVEVSARKVTVPATCVCCHGHADGDFSASFTRTSGKRVIREQTRSWAFPCCHRCLAHARLWNSAGTIALIVVVVAALIGLLLGASSVGAGAGLFALSLPLALVLASRRRSAARAARSPGCARSAHRSRTSAGTGASSVSTSLPTRTRPTSRNATVARWSTCTPS